MTIVAKEKNKTKSQEFKSINFADAYIQAHQSNIIESLISCNNIYFNRFETIY